MPDQRALRVVANQVGERDVQPERVAAERHPGAGAADPVDDRRHLVGVLVRQRQFRHVHRRVDPGAAEDEDVTRAYGLTP
ncbi:hypothetical protein [Nonomuraea sp. NPDC049480]|uniref:hypothetical protein n=1 Tax=Nonomuraea sp. NPDC049480 TaxID=3364353 RepID=UPI003793E399